MNGPLGTRITQAPSGPITSAARARVTALVESEAFAPAREVFLKSRLRTLLAGLAEYSPYLWSLARDNPARAARLCAEAPEASLETLLQDLARAEYAGEAEAMGGLRDAKREAALLVALAEIAGVWDIVASTAALSRFADTAVSAALRFALQEALSAR